MPLFTTLSDLNDEQTHAYNKAKAEAFPKIIQASSIIKKFWNRLESFFPEVQIIMLGDDENLIGFMNMIPFYWDKPLTQLPETGWDWMLQKGIKDFENKLTPNTLGGLQIIIPTEHQGKGHSKTIIDQGKRTLEKFGLDKLLIPIRPTLKHKHPEKSMKEYLEMKTEDIKIYDPWIRTHVKGGAQIIKICSNSMNIQGDFNFWEELLGKKIVSSKAIRIQGALNLVNVNIEENIGEYREENIWICYE